MLSSPANYAPSHLRPCSPWPRNHLRSVVTEDAPLTSTCLWGGVKHGEEAPREAWSERSKEVYPYVKCFTRWQHPSDWSAHLMGWAVLYFVCFFFTKAKTFFFFLLYFSSLFRFQVHPCAGSIAETCIGKFSSSILHPPSVSFSHLSREDTRESEGERGLLSASPSSLIIFGC